MDVDFLSDIDDAELAGLLEEDGFELSRDDIQVRVNNGLTQVSFAQQRLWFLQLLEPEDTSYNLLRVYKIQGKIRLNLFECAFEQVIARHQVLNCRFEENNTGLYQVELDKLATLECIDLSKVDESKRKSRLQQIRRTESNRAFKLAHESSIRMSLIIYSKDEAYLMLHLHHIVTDAWSTDIMFRDFAAYYSAIHTKSEVLLPQLPVQYADYAAWQKNFLTGEKLNQQLEYWLDYVNGVPSTLELVCDMPRPLFQSNEGALQLFTLTDKLSKQIRAFSLQTSVNIFTIFMAAWQVLLRQKSGSQNKFLIGVPNANRHRIEVEELIGCFINTQVYKADFTRVNTVQELIMQINQDAAKAQDFQDLPFDLLVDKLNVDRDVGRSPLFQTMFNFETKSVVVAQQVDTLPGIKIEAISEPHCTAKFELTLNVYDSKQLFNCDIEYATALFKGESIDRLVEDYQALLKQIINKAPQALRT